MSFIRFESALEKEKVRQELREARNEMLERAKRNAERRAEQAVQKELIGEIDWVLPTVVKKLDKLNKSAKVSKKQKKENKQKRVNIKKSKKSKHFSSSSSELSDSIHSGSSVEEELRSKPRKKSKRKHKKKNHKESSSVDGYSEGDEQSKRKNKHKRKRKRKYSSSSCDEKPVEELVEQSTQTEIKSSTTLQRDDWMTNADSLMLKTFSKERVERKPNEKQQIIAYDPAKSVRELNPYWKSTGTGLPAFQKPKDDSDEEHPRYSGNYIKMSRKNWQKKSNTRQETVIQKSSTVKDSTGATASSASSSSQDSEEETDTDAVQASQINLKNTSFLTDQQMNELGAKILKAEILGNISLASELKQKLEEARERRAVVKDRKQLENKWTTHDKQMQLKQREEEHILLTHTDERGNTRPLAQSRQLDPRDLYGGRKGARKQKRAETHKDGERVRYFADDDKYDIKQMFEREKYTTAADANLQFANIAGKHKNPNDDLEDIFADKVRRNIDNDKSDKKELQRAILEQKNLSKQLDNCDKCFDSDKMDKKRLVSLGDKVYLALPWHIGLQPGHCIIAPVQHVSCCTQLDENTWEEVTNFRRALTSMFAAQRKDVIFFEIGNKLQRRPHVCIHCIPIPEKEGEMAPFYFKKAIEESEREWSVNKQLVSLRDKGLRSCIPKGLPYFWVNFGMDSGFAHVIEDEDRFPENFALEILGGMLELDANKWRKPQKEQNIITRVKMFADWWKKFDCTE